MISAVLLAAGSSSRMMGKNKLLLRLKDKLIFEHTIESILASNAGEVIVVMGHQANEISQIIKRNNYPVETVVNHAYEEGMTSSIKTGVNRVSPTAEGIMICLADMPFIQMDHYNLLIDEFYRVKKINTEPILIPYFDTNRGNPAIFSQTYQSRILEHEKISGCNGLIRDYPDNVFKITLDSNMITLDIDTPEDYQLIVRDD